MKRYAEKKYNNTYFFIQGETQNHPCPEECEPEYPDIIPWQGDKFIEIDELGNVTYSNINNTSRNRNRTNSSITENPRNYNINFESTNIDLDTEPLNGEYDIITSFEVLEHLFNPLFNLIEIKRVLKPNGVLYISTPLYKPRIIKSPYHFHEFSEDELMNLIKRADFLVKRKK